MSPGVLAGTNPQGRGSDPEDMTAPKRPSISLRPYQEEALARILACRDRGVDRVIVVAPTGTGKTTLFSALVGEFVRTYHRPALVLAHRQELLDQAANRLSLQNPELKVAVERGAKRAPANVDVVVASVQSLGRPESGRLEGFYPGLLIVDEAHHAAATTYQHVMKSFGCYEGGCFTVGVTATPHRMDNKPLHGEEESIFQEVAFSYTLREAVRDGWLADLRGFRVATGIDLSRVRRTAGDYNAKQLQDAVNTEARNELAFDHWRNVASERRTIVFCTGVEHAEEVAKLFRDNGCAAESVNGAMKGSEREGIMSRFASGDTQVLTNVDIATEGFDVPEASCVLMLRPTQSWALYTQMVGRGVRPLAATLEGKKEPKDRRSAIAASEKPDCIVIDIVDNGQRNDLNEKPKEKEEARDEPSLTAIMGLPPDFDLEGNSVGEALAIWEGLDPAHRAIMFRRPTRFEDLGTTLTAVDLLAELSVAEETIAVSRFAWLKTGDGEYRLPCGSSEREPGREARLVCDTLGRYHLTLDSENREPIVYELGDNMQRAFQLAERKIKDIWPFVGGLISARGKWREGPVTDRQKAELLHLGVEDHVIEMVENAGKAWTLIEVKRKELREKVPV
jgi:superfamily II DNA or RNA helicase